MTSLPVIVVWLPPIKNPGYAYGYNGYLPPVTVTSDVIGQFCVKQRWSLRGRPWPRGHILKSLALASKPQVLKNWPVLGSRTALFFELLKFCVAPEKFFGRRFFLEIAWKILVKTFFFRRALALVSLVLGLGLEHACPWPLEGLSSERLSLALASDFFCVLGLGLEPSVLDSTSDVKLFFILELVLVMIRVGAKFRLWIWLTLCLKLTLTIPNLPYFDVRFVTSDVIAADRKFRYRFATGGKLILFKHILLSSILVNNRVIVIENGQKNFQLQLQLSTFENVQLQLQQNSVTNYNLVDYNYNFSKPGAYRFKSEALYLLAVLCQIIRFKIFSIFKVVLQFFMLFSKTKRNSFFMLRLADQINSRCSLTLY